MSPIKAELLKTLETAPEGAIEQTLLYLKTLLPQNEVDFQPRTALGKKTLGNPTTIDRRRHKAPH